MSTRRKAFVTISALLAGGAVGIFLRSGRDGAKDESAPVQASPELAMLESNAPPRRARARAVEHADPASAPAVEQGGSTELFFERAADEWQGMRVRKDVKLPCESSAACNLGAACIDGVCSACRTDDDCEPDETCSMDHCLPDGNVSCKRRADCDEGELCFLTEYAGTTHRKNELVRSYCAETSGLNPFAAALSEPVIVPEEVQAAAAPNPSLEIDDMAQDLLAQAREDLTSEP